MGGSWLARGCREDPLRLDLHQQSIRDLEIRMMECHLPIARATSCFSVEQKPEIRVLLRSGSSDDPLSSTGSPRLRMWHAYSVSSRSTRPSVPSTVTSWPSCRRLVASDVPTTAGMPYSRATSEACAATDPPSVTMAIARENSGVQAGVCVPTSRRQQRFELLAQCGCQLLQACWFQLFAPRRTIAAHGRPGAGEAELARRGM